MTHAPTVTRPLPTRRVFGLIAALGALAALALPSLAAARPTPTLPKPAVLTFTVAKVEEEAGTGRNDLSQTPDARLTLRA